MTKPVRLSPPPPWQPRHPRAAAALTAGRIAARRTIRRFAPPVPDGSRPTGGYRKVFIVGCPRSGTTWLLRLFAGHPAVVSGRESHAWRDVAGIYEREGPPAVRWARVIRRYDVMSEEQPWVGLRWYVDRGTFVRLVEEVGADVRLADADAADEVIERVFDTFFALRATNPADVFVEKTPAHLQVADRILRRFPGARIIEVVRDGRDVAVSMDSLATTQRWLPPTRELQARRWAQDVRMGAELRADPEFADRIALVHFEDLRRDPVAELRRVLRFAGLDDPTPLVQTLLDRHDIARARDRGPGRPMRKGAVGDWREVLSSDDLELFDRVAGDTLAASGYG